ncbi:type II toxin-antitoxin system HicA family toxin [bacterium]|nr:type II toxin-antitoxin system HicA family toxin [bacterium]
MSGLEKLKRKLRQNPGSIRFGELVRVLNDLGFHEVRAAGSHRIFRPDGQGVSIMIVKPHGTRTFCSTVDVKKVVGLLEKL